MAAILHISINFSAFNNNPIDDFSRKQSVDGFKVMGSLSRAKIVSLSQAKFSVSSNRLSFWGVGSGGNDVLVVEDRSWKGKKRVVQVKFNKGFQFNGGGGGGGGGREDSNTARLLGNLALAIGLTYLSMTGQLGWVLDAIVSVWLLAVLLPIVGLGAFLWWAGRDILQGTCPNCGNDFQVFKSTLHDDLQLCPFCSQPFSVVDDKFVRDPVKFSNQSTTFDEAFNNFSPRAKKGKDSSVSVVDVEAEIKDAD